MEIVEDPAFLCHSVEVGRFVSRCSEGADVGVAHVVDEDDDDVRRVGWRLFLRCFGVGRPRQQREKKNKRYDECLPAALQYERSFHRSTESGWKLEANRLPN